MARNDKHNKMLVENLKKNHKEITDIGLYCYAFLQGAKETDKNILEEIYKIINNVQVDDLVAIEERIAGLKGLIKELIDVK